MKLDQTRYQEALELARFAHIVFDAMRHPRDINGRFREVTIKNDKLGSVFSKRTVGLPDNTQDLHTVKDKHGRWHYTKERNAFHKALIEAYLKGHKGNREVGDRSILFTAGGAGSGKTTAVEALGSALVPPDAVTIDPDDIKLQIPEYRRLLEEGDGRAATLSHDESIDIAQKLLHVATERGFNVVMDGTGASPMFTTRISRALDQDYEVEVAYFNTDTETALKRIADRKAATGRGVNEEVARSMHRNASRLFQQVYEFGTKLKLYDTTNQNPALFAEAEAGADLDVWDPDLFEAFLDKAHETWTSPTAKPVTHSKPLNSPAKQQTLPV